MAKNKSFGVAIKNAVNGSTLELHFLDVIADGFDWYTWEYVSMLTDTINKVQAANPTTIKVVINSQGGDAALGLAIYNFLKNHSASIEVDIVGLAGSIASVIAMAADKGKLKMARNSFMVIHQAWGGVVGNASEMRAAADVTDLFTKQVVDVYNQRTGITTDKLNAYIADGDYWMDGVMAKELGFADELYNDNAEFKIAACINNLDPRYKNIPSNIVDVEDNDHSFSSFIKENIMSLKSIFAKFKTDTKQPIKAETPKPVEPVVPVVPVVEPVVPVVEPVTPVTEPVPADDTLTEAVTNLINSLETELPNEISAAVATATQALTAELAEVKKSYKTLVEDVKKLAGGESKEQENHNEAKKPSFGSFSND